MEDKYFNEFFDKLYNGKLNIYEDEEEETSEEYDIKDKIFDNHDKNFNNFKGNLETIKNGSKFLYDYDDSFIKDNIQGFCRIYDYTNDGKTNKDPIWRRYTNNLEQENRKILINYIGDVGEKIKNLCLQKNWFINKTTFDKAINKILKIENYYLVPKNFKETHLNGFWELYDIENNKTNDPFWRVIIRNNESFKGYFKEYINNFLNGNGQYFIEKLKEMEYQKILSASILKVIHDHLDIIKSVENYGDFKHHFKDDEGVVNEKKYWSFIKKYLNGYWELYDIQSNKETLTTKTNTPSFRLVMRENESFKKYLKKIIEDIYPGIKDKLKKLNDDYTYEHNNPVIPENTTYEISKLEGILDKFSQYKHQSVKIAIEKLYDAIKNIKENNYTELETHFKNRELNGFWELFGFVESDIKGDQPIWREIIRENESFKEYLKKFIEDKDSGFEERLNELFEQKGVGYEKTFTKKYDGENYFKKIKITNESRIHNLDSKEINIIISSIINNYVNSQIKKDSEYLTTKLTDGDINCIKEKLVNPIYNNITNYLKNNKVVSYDLKCVQPLTNNGKTVINIGEKIEVKDILKLDSYYSEYIASPVKKSDNIETPKGKEIYKVFVENLLEKIKNDSSGTFDKIINDVYDNISGMIIADDIYVPKENITLYISSQGQGYGRITLRYNINPKGNFYKIEKPKDYKYDGKVTEPLKIRELEEEEKNKLKPMSYVNPIYPEQGNVDESYDSYLDQLVENFFNTGKLFS